MLADNDPLLQDPESPQQQVYFPFIITISLIIRTGNVTIQLHLPQNVMILNRILKIVRLSMLRNHKPGDNLRKIVEAAISNIDFKYFYICLI